MDSPSVMIDEKQHRLNKVWEKMCPAATPASPAIDMPDLMKAHKTIQTEREKIECRIKHALARKSSDKHDARNIIKRSKEKRSIFMSKRRGCIEAEECYDPHYDPELKTPQYTGKIERILRFLNNVIYFISKEGRKKWLRETIDNLSYLDPDLTSTVLKMEDSLHRRNELFGMHAYSPAELIINDVFRIYLNHKVLSTDEYAAHAQTIRNGLAQMLLWREMRGTGPLRRRKTAAEDLAQYTNGAESSEVTFPFYTSLDDKDLQEMCKYVTSVNTTRKLLLEEFKRPRGENTIYDLFYGYVPEGEGNFKDSKEAEDYRITIEEGIPVNLIAMTFMALSGDIYINRQDMCGIVLNHNIVIKPYHSCGHMSQYYYLPICPDKCELCWRNMICKNTCFEDSKLLKSTVLNYFGGDEKKMAEERNNTFGFEEKHAKDCSVRTARSRGKEALYFTNLNHDDGLIGARTLGKKTDPKDLSRTIPCIEYQIRKPLKLWSKVDTGQVGQMRGSRGLGPPHLSDSNFPHKINERALAESTVGRYSDWQ